MGPNGLAEYQQMLNKIAKDPNRYTEKYRPQYHFSPVEGSMGDPNGLVYYKGEYHLMFQHTHPLLRDGSQWGHAVSNDLVHWKHLPAALCPDEIGNTICSGSVVVDWNDTSGFFSGGSGLVAIFTHTLRNPHLKNKLQRQSIAYSTDRGHTWIKYAHNPVIPNNGFIQFRDPKVFWHKPRGKWIMVVGVEYVWFYSSDNLREWTLESANENIRTECPDFFELPVDGDPDNTKWVLNLAGKWYYIGSFDGHKFVPESEKILLTGSDAYASQTWSDIPADDGRRIMVSWTARHQRHQMKHPTSGWKGSMTIPYQLELKTFPEGIRMIQKPIVELRKLRQKSWRWETADISGSDNLVKGVHGKALEIVAEFEPKTAKQFGFKVHKGGSEQTVIGYDTSEEKLFVDRVKSGSRQIWQTEDTLGIISKPQQGLSLVNNTLKMHIFVDRSSVEVIGNEGRAVIITKVFPKDDSDGLELYADGGDVRLLSLKIYELATVWR